MTEKIILRKTMRQLRDSFTQAEQAALATALLEQLRSWQLYQQAPMLCTFVSTGSEPDTAPIIRQALQDRKPVAVPKCLSRQQMAFYLLEDVQQLQPGAYGIYEPDDSCKMVSQFLPGTLCLVPGLAFDRFGGRLGYGAGYYDRFLADHPTLISAGICSSRCVLPHVPTEPTDQAMQYLMTEKEMEVIHG